MARNEHDREDLLREATALVQRVEVRVVGESEAITIGFRRDGSGSLFFRGDLVFQFNQYCELRRGYWNGELIKAEAGQLVALSRVRTPREVQLVRRELDAQETESFLRMFRDKAQVLLTAIADGTVTVAGQVPDDENVLNLAADWLESFSTVIPIADRPNLGKASGS